MILLLLVALGGRSSPGATDIERDTMKLPRKYKSQGTLGDSMPVLRQTIMCTKCAEKHAEILRIVGAGLMRDAFGQEGEV